MTEIGQGEWKFPAQHDNIFEETMLSEAEAKVSPLVTEVVCVLPENVAPESIQQPGLPLKPSQKALYSTVYAT
jgi:hypothetical protein